MVSIVILSFHCNSHLQALIRASGKPYLTVLCKQIPLPLERKQPLDHLILIAIVTSISNFSAEIVFFIDFNFRHGGTGLGLCIVRSLVSEPSLLHNIGKLALPPSKKPLFIVHRLRRLT